MPGIGGRQGPLGVAEVLGQVRLAHRGVRAERDQHGDLGRPAVQRLVHRGQQQRQRAAAGAVGHDDAHAAAVEILRGQALRDELRGSPASAST